MKIPLDRLKSQMNMIEEMASNLEDREYPFEQRRKKYTYLFIYF